MYLAEEAASSTSTFTGFDIFILLFTVILVFAMYQLVKSEKKNFFAIGFTFVTLVLFLFMDVTMILGWFGKNWSMIL